MQFKNMSDNLTFFEELSKKFTVWDSFRIGLSIPFFFYAVVAVLYSYFSVQNTSLMFALTGTAIGSLGFGFSMISSVQNGVRLREIKQLIESDQVMILVDA